MGALQDANGHDKAVANGEIAADRKSGVVVGVDAAAEMPAADSLRRWAVASGHQGLWIVDENGRTKLVNEQMAKMLHTTPEAVVGRRVFEFVEPEDHERFRLQALEFRKGKSFNQRIRYRRDDGTTFAAQLESVPVFAPDGTFAGGLGMAVDITAILEAEAARRESEARVRAVEAQLRQAQKMEAVGRLAGGIAHDFNNMLSVILGYGDSLLERVQGQPDVYEDIGEILTAARRSAELTRQLLMFSRRSAVKATVLNVAELTGNMLRMIQRIVGEDIDVRLDVPKPTTPPLVCIDRCGLEQVLMNLVVNARDAMPAGGRLTIVILVARSQVVIRVRDNGCGMDEATIARAFDPFFTTKEQGKGTGLGLSTVYGIVEQAGGTIRIDSAIGVGTTVEVSLPCAAEATVPAASRAPSPRGDTRPARILLVEDEEQVRAVVKRALERDGHQVLEAKNPLEALEGDHDVDLLLTDVIMPLMSGAELARRFTKQSPSAKVLFMSGYADDNIVQHGVISASVAYLQKPFAPADLTKKVREVLAAAKA